MPSRPDIWHDDAAAGVRFPVPFADASVKTGAQVQALVAERPEVRLPETVTYTSGIYAKDGSPFVVVWTRPAAEALTRAGLDRLLAASPAELKAAYGVDGLRFDPKTVRGVGEAMIPGPLKGKILVQLTKDGSTQVGYYFQEAKDAAGFEKLVAGLEVAADKRLDREALPRGAVFWGTAAALAVGLGLVAGVLVFRGSRK